MENSDLFSLPEGDSFYISFTDIVTLLLIFFIYLISISSFNMSDIETLSKHVGSKFKIDSLVEEVTKKTEKRVLTDPWMNISQTLHNNLLPEETIRLSLDQELLFKPGSAALLDSGLVYLKKLAQALSEIPIKLLLKGILIAPRFIPSYFQPIGTYHPCEQPKLRLRCNDLVFQVNI